MIPWPPDWAHYYALTAWRFSAPDTVAIRLHANMALSSELVLTATDDSLIGTAHASSDYGGDTMTVAVLARRVACPISSHGAT